MLSLVSILTAASLISTDIRPILVEQGFPGPVNGRETISYVGHIQQNRTEYRVYLYHGLFRAAAVDHGVNWLIVIKNGATYYGGYHIPMPTRCKIEQRKVICDTGMFEFTKNGPPGKILFDGEELSFEHGDTIKTSRP